LVAAFVFFASAPAAVAEPGYGEAREALHIAIDKWGSTCTERPQVRFRTLRSDTLGMARWQGMWDIPPREREDCEILLNSRKDWTWLKLCTTVVHEYGHLDGHDHSESEESVMEREYTHPYKGCRRD
jgi:Matrixin